MRPVVTRQVLARFSVSALAASLPLLYVSLLRPPPAALAGDTAFWFLMSNCVVAAIVAADDAGTLFFGSSKPDGPCCHDDDLSYVSGAQPAAAFVEDSSGAVVPLVPPDDVPTAVKMEGGRVQEDFTSSNSRHHALLPFMIQGDEDPASKASTDRVHASVLRHDHGDDEVVKEPIASNNNKTSNNAIVFLEGLGQVGEEERPSSASDEAIPGADEPAIVEADDGALAGPEPELWPSSLVTGTGLEEVQEEEEIPEAWAIAQQSRTPDLQQGRGAGEGKQLRRSATEGSKPAAAEESEYGELSDEDLNRRVEEFIARFNREMRRQIEQEAAAGA